MDDSILRNIFDPGWWQVQPRDYQEGEEKEKRALERGEFEKLAYNEIVANLEEDLKKLGTEITYTTKIIIGEIAMKLILISRIKFEFSFRPVVSYKKLIKPHHVRPDTHGGKYISHDLIDVQEVVHPIYSEFLPRLEKELNRQLGLLGLLPQQQIERQKLILIEKLRKRLMQVEKGNNEYSVDAIIEKKVEI